jgi:hypothetical protein
MSCQSSCAASADARATCAAPAVTVTGPPAAMGVLSATLAENLPALLLVARTRGLAFLKEISPVVNGGQAMVTSSKLDAHGSACVTIMTADLQQAVSDFGAAVSAAGSVTSTNGLLPP